MIRKLMCEKVLDAIVLPVKMGRENVLWLFFICTGLFSLSYGAMEGLYCGKDNCYDSKQEII